MKTPKKTMHGLNGTRVQAGGIANGKRNKAKTHCPKGHEYTPENTAPNGKDGKGRSCRKCKAEREAIRRMRIRGDI